MKLASPALLLLPWLLTACGMQLLEEATEIAIPRDCREATKVFNAFIMRAKNISWNVSQEAKEKTSLLSIELTFENATNWPHALSNTGNGILYSVEYSLSQENGSSYAPKEATGIFKDIHREILLKETAEGKVTFAAPKANSLLIIERKFSGTSVPGRREDHMASCKIFPAELLLVQP
jgi:hypothetical protein